MSPLLTDSYQFSMLQAYLDQGMSDPAVFELFVRRMPQDRSFLVMAGLEEALRYLMSLRFGSDEIEWLRSTGRYRENLLSYLEGFRFTGDAWAMPEGEIFFQDEPVLRIRAPLPEAQLVETRLMNLLQHPILVASKAARCVLVSQGRFLVDFGLRRAHGAEAGLWTARASYLAGFHGTSTVLAGRCFGIPVIGTMAHSFVEAHPDESSAFEGFARSNPGNTTLLIDTYDTEEAARKLKRVAADLGRWSIRIQGVRLDSGDLHEHSRKVRAILDRSGLGQVRIFASGNVDEFAIHGLLAGGAPIDGFGVGTHLATSEDAPFLDCAYKLQEYGGRPRRKRSEGKATFPGAKQVYRVFGEEGVYACDRVTLESEPALGAPLLQHVIRGGRQAAAPRSLAEIREASLARLARLPPSLKSIVNPRSYPVGISEGLRDLARRADRAA